MDQNLIRWLSAAGYLPVPVPNVLSVGTGSEESAGALALRDWLESVRPQALVLSGGNNIGDCTERDNTESYLLTWAEKQRVPVLGICRGMEMMAVWAGTKLEKVEGHVRTRHHLNINPVHDAVGETRDGNKPDTVEVNDRLNGGNAEQIFPESVNSFHDLGVLTCPAGFHVLARAREDGVIEAIGHKQLPWEGWMWHPEREEQFSVQDHRRLKELFQYYKRWR